MKKIFILTLISLFIYGAQAESEEARGLRYPNASKTHITFCHAGDIYVVKKSGGLARRITSSKGLEMFPRFSPDGSEIAFSAEYDGNREIYTIPAFGGNPERLTYSMDLQGLPDRMGPDKIIMQWSKDGSKILYRSRHEIWNAWIGKLYMIDKNGGLPEELPLPKGGFASLSPDGSKIAYNRIFREFRTWKRYRGGQADEIWIYDFKTKSLEQITSNSAQDIIPMWLGDKIYYISDRNSVMNMFCYDLKTKNTKQITNFKKYDIKFPSLGPDNITFENGGYIYLLDPTIDHAEKVNIEIAEDFPGLREKIINVDKKITNFEISPDGKRALFGARGDVYTVPAHKGHVRNLTKTSNAHERNSKWSPDGKWIAYISDKSGEDEIYICKPDGSEETQLTNDGSSYRYALLWSPDGKKILSSDKSFRLYYVDIDSKKTTQVAKSKSWEITDYKWSYDSKWIAYSDASENLTNNVIYLYSLDTEKASQVTDEFFNSSNPEFAPCGKYLFFVSQRTFRHSEGAFERSYIYRNMSKIYGITLQDSLQSPFKFESDEVAIEDDSNGKKTKKKKDKDFEATMTIDFKGINDRIFELPVRPGNYWNLKAAKNKKLYYNSRGFNVFDFETLKESKVGDFYGFEISNDGKKILFKSGANYYIENLRAKVKPGKGKLNLAGMKYKVNRKEEWNQIFNEAWRQMKYFFYDENMHGVDWNTVHDKYAEIVPYVHHRADLTYLIGEMIGELNCGHAYVGGGDQPVADKTPIGLLGAELSLDKKSGYYRIDKIFKGRNWEEKTRSPFTEPGIVINEGDYIISIDGIELTKNMHPYKALVNKAGTFVSIEVNSKPQKKGSMKFDVKTIASESGLRYFDWVETNRKKVDELSGGKIGYVHIPDMLGNGLNEFVKYFYPQNRKEALIIDDRYNGGGNVSPMIIERLQRIMTIAGNARNQEIVTEKPSAAFTGPMVCLLNELSASDGDMFPYQFKKLKLGKLIGKRSWGGVIGIRGSLPFIDGGYLYKPEFSHFSTDGKWVLEGVGMMPDIEVDNLPQDEYVGKDAQLEKAVEVLLKEIKVNTKPQRPDVPKNYPDKSK